MKNNNDKEINKETQIRELQKTIREKNNEISRLKKIIDSIPGDIYWKDKESVYLGINIAGRKNLRRMGFTWKESDIIGKTDHELYEKKTADKFRENDLYIMQTGLVFAREEPAILPSGEKIIQLSTKRPLLNNDGHVIGIIGNTIDITYLKKIEADLQTAKEKAEAASRAKSEFIANISHDIRTPITGMLGILQDLSHTTKEIDLSLKKNNLFNNQDLLSLIQRINHQIKDDSDTLISSMDQLMALLDGIVELVRLEKNVTTDQLESFDAHQLIQHNIELLQPVAQQKKLNLIGAIDRRVPQYITGLRNHADRALLNLISNALKFTKKGSVKVGIRPLEDTPTIYKKDDKVILEIFVEDTGIGIPEDKYEIIFENFSRLTPAYEGIYKGFGLGLYMVKLYVKAMDGTIKVESEIGKGTSFKMTIPFVVSDKADKPRYSASNIPIPFVSDSPSSVLIPTKIDSISANKVLLVENNLIAANVITKALKNFHSTVDIAKNGKQAIQKAQNTSYDIILLNVELADMRGTEVAKTIRLFPDSKKSQVPIVAVTEHPDHLNIQQECADAGVQDILPKPLNASILESVLHRFVFNNSGKKLL